MQLTITLTKEVASEKEVAAFLAKLEGTTKLEAAAGLTQTTPATKTRGRPSKAAAAELEEEALTEQDDADMEASWNMERVYDVDEEEDAPTKEDVIRALKSLTAQNKGDATKAKKILGKFNVKSVHDLKEKQYADVIALSEK